MTHAFPKLLTAVGAAAFLFASPVAAQDSAGGGGADVVPMQDFDERVTPAHRTAMSTAFRGMDLPPAATDVTIDPTPGAAIPGTLETHPVPDTVVEAAPDVAGYEYVTLPDGRVALVHPEDRTIATVLD